MHICSYTLVNLNSYETDKKLFILAVKRVLDNINPRVYEQVENRLFQNYGCNIGDCLEHQKYLKKILSDLFGQVSIFIIESITNTLKESKDKSLTIFLSSK